jgi:hypothetical protein
MKKLFNFLFIVSVISVGVFCSGCEQTTEPSAGITNNSEAMGPISKAYETRPFVAEVVATLLSQVNDSVSVYYGTGTATHWGLFTLIDSVTHHISLPGYLVEGNDWVTVANGDLVHMTWFADYYDPGTWVWEIIGGTGRFEGATGEGTWTGEFLPSGDLWVRYTGTITY